MFVSGPAQQQQMTYAPQQAQQPQHRSLLGDNIGSDGPLFDDNMGSDGPLLDDYIGSDGTLFDDSFLGCFSSSSESTPGSSASSPSTTTPTMA